ncbi:MAG: MlaD family protein [Planctomycetota bacterium]
MRTQTSYLLIGAFVLSGIVLLTASLVALNAGARRREVIKAETLFEESVSGLEVGAPVRFRGVTVGRVTQITVAGALYQETQHTYVVVRFELWGPSGFPIARLRETLPARIDEGLRVRQASTGVTGVSFLEADILDDASKYPPKARDWMPSEQRDEYLYIPSAPSTFGEVVNSVERVLDDVVRADLPKVASDIREAVTGIRAEIGNAGLGELRVEVKQVLQDVRDIARRAGEDLSRAVTSLETGSRDVSAAVASLRERVIDPRLDDLVADLNGATKKLNEVLLDARAALGDVQGLLAGRSGTVRTILDNLERASAHLRSLAATAEQYPSWLLFGSPPAPRDRR